MASRKQIAAAARAGSPNAELPLAASTATPEEEADEISGDVEHDGEVDTEEPAEEAISRSSDLEVGKAMLAGLGRVVGEDAAHHAPPAPAASGFNDTSPERLAELRSVAAIPPPRPMIEVPKIGTELRCDRFEGGFSLVGTVQDHLPRGEGDADLLLWIASLGRHWPILASRVRGNRWLHVDADYSPPGQDADFDSRFRTKKLTVHDLEPVPPKPVFKPPRRARRGYVWMKTTRGVVTIAFQENGDRLRDWPAKKIGEFPEGAVHGNPECFEDP